MPQHNALSHGRSHSHILCLVVVVVIIRRYYTADASAAYPGAQDATPKGNESDKLLAGVVTQ